MVRSKKYFPMALFFGEVIAHRDVGLWCYQIQTFETSSLIENTCLCLFPFFVSILPPLGHERPYACVDFKRSRSKNPVNIGQPESTNESPDKQLTARKSPYDSTQNGTNMSRPTKDPVQYAAFCSLAHQPCPQGYDYALTWKMLFPADIYLMIDIDIWQSTRILKVWSAWTNVVEAQKFSKCLMPQNLNVLKSQTAPNGILKTSN